MKYVHISAQSISLVATLIRLVGRRYHIITSSLNPRITSIDTVFYGDQFQTSEVFDLIVCVMYSIYAS